MQQPHVRLRPSRCSRAHRQEHLWAAALCVLLLWQGPAAAARSHTAHRLPRQRALKTSHIGSSDGSLQQQPNPVPQGLEQVLEKSSSHTAQPSSLLSASDSSVVSTDSLPASGSSSSSGTSKSSAGGSMTRSSSSSSNPSAVASPPAAHAAKTSVNVSSQLGSQLQSGKQLPAALPTGKGTSEAAWLNVSLEFPSNAKAPHNYAEALHKSLLFYWAQRSGPMPVKRLAWRSDSCLECVGAHGEVGPPCLPCIWRLYIPIPQPTGPFSYCTYPFQRSSEDVAINWTSCYCSCFLLRLPAGVGLKAASCQSPPFPPPSRPGVVEILCVMCTADC